MHPGADHDDPTRSTASALTAKKKYNYRVNIIPGVGSGAQHSWTGRAYIETDGRTELRASRVEGAFACYFATGITGERQMDRG